MEELTPAEDSPTNSPLPEAGNDPDDPLRPEVEEGDSDQTPPAGNPRQDMEVTEDKEELSDDESILSDIDEAQFEDFDPAAIAIEERPGAVAVDETNIGAIGVHKRKRTADDETITKKKKKLGKKDRSKRSRRTEDLDENFSGGEEVEGKRVRKSKDSAGRRERAKPRRASPENEEDLTPEERRRRALDRAMDEALKNPNKRKKKMDGIDLESQNDELIENTRRRMTEAAKADTEARQQGHPAMQKLKMLPEVVALLNRNNLRDQLVDPDINLLEAVRFFLEPLNDGSLPAYNIQRELFSALSKLPINKDALVASGIGKVTLFYTKSQKPEANIKRQAERLLGEWTRPILKRTVDYRKRDLKEAVYDPTALPIRDTPESRQASAAAVAAAARERALALPVKENRARIEGGLSSYSIVPRSTLMSQGQFARPVGAGGGDTLKRMKARQMGKTGLGSSN